MTPKNKLIKGSRVPVAYLIDYIKDGYSISEFLSAYPWIKRKEVESVLDEIRKHASTGYAI
ncbi:MAG: DUF433 domain-containing protein [Patescibacteria group bacterium]